MTDDDKQGLKETFKLKASGDNESEIKRIYVELKGANITGQNYLKFYERVKSTLSIINAQIENEFSQYSEYEAEYKKLGDQDRTKKAIENKIVPIEVFTARLNMNRKERQIISWFVIAYDITDTMMRKLATALGETQAFEIKRDTLKEMREMEKARNDLFLEIMKSRSDEMDSKFLSGLKALQEENRIDRKENSNIMASAIVTAAQYNAQTIRQLFDLIAQSYPERFEEVKKMKDLFDETELEMKTKIVKQVKDKKEPQSIVERVTAEVPRGEFAKKKKTLSDIDEQLGRYKPPKAMDDIDDKPVEDVESEITL